MTRHQYSVVGEGMTADAAVARIREVDVKGREDLKGRISP
jgi:hypothetical protein